MEPRQSVPCLTVLRLIFTVAYNGKHMHSQEEICGTFQNSPIWHTVLLLGTVRLSIAQCFQLFLVYLFFLALIESFWIINGVDRIQTNRNDDSSSTLAQCLIDPQ